VGPALQNRFISIFFINFHQFFRTFSSFRVFQTIVEKLSVEILELGGQSSFRFHEKSTELF